MQPFGGHGLSGTGPKAGGPLYLKRLLATAPASWPSLPAGDPSPTARRFADFIAARGEGELAKLCAKLAEQSRCGASVELPGPTGERNVYSLAPRGAVLCDAATEEALIVQIACALATGNRAVLQGAPAARLIAALPRELLDSIALAGPNENVDASLTDREGDALIALLVEYARRDGLITPVFRLSADGLRGGDVAPLDFLLKERSLCVNTAAAGGNASLMTIG